MSKHSQFQILLYKKSFGFIFYPFFKKAAITISNYKTCEQVNETGLK